MKKKKKKEKTATERKRDTLIERISKNTCSSKRYNSFAKTGFRDWTNVKIEIQAL